MPLFKIGGNKNTEHFKSVFDSCFQTIVSFALKYTNNDIEAAHDIVQESFIELWHNKKINEDTERAKAFLYLTTKNKALNYLKHERVKDNYINKNRDLIDSERYYMDQLIQQETIQLIQNAINKLPEKTRKVVLLKLEGLKNNEIAEVTGTSVETVKYHKTTAFKILKENLKDKVWLILPLFF